ncbi:hypothetical protein RhiLY_00500 [Ceratobasidium sp. AG-Ba]|nr:hypothetical protein RhiLY_00500 [Ceratobasidium sp. AG-Ba]
MSMFWRFGFHGTNNIDTLLNQDDVSLESILDHDDLLSECKQQNPRLIDYLQHPEILQRLFAYVTGEIVSEGRGSFKYPYVSAEVLCCEIWAIVERCTENSAQILAPFWDTVLSTPPDELKTKASVAAHFSKISAVFLVKKPAEMLNFIKSIPNVVDRMLAHIEAPPFVDLLFRIIQLDDNPGNIGVMDWLSSQNFIPNLVDRLSPRYPPSVHLVVADLLKGIISVASPSPGSFNVNGPHDGGPTGPVTNRFVRELASIAIVETMPPSDLNDYIERPPLPNAESATSSLTQIISIFVELIRKNNSDYFEPYLFHTLRDRLMRIQQQHLDEMHDIGADMDSAQRAQEERDILERGMADMVDHLGIVHLGKFLRILSNRLPDFQELLRRPRSLAGYVPTSVGDLIPTTSLLKYVPPESATRIWASYDEQGRLMGGLDALEQLARVIDPNVSSDAMMDQSIESDTAHDPRDLHVSSLLRVVQSFPTMESVDDDHGDLDDPQSDDLTVTKPVSRSSSDQGNPAMPPPSETLDPFSDPEPTVGVQTLALLEPMFLALIQAPSDTALPRSISVQYLIANYLNIVSTILDFFFDFPWNNFLHNAVYDLLHQILTGRVDNELSRRVTIGMFRDARLVHRILEGSRRNDVVSAQQKGLRLGYMGHLILISDDIVAALEHYPHSLLEALSPYVPQPDWDDFVAGQYKETKQRDLSQLGGGRPTMPIGIAGMGRGGPIGGMGPNRFGDAPNPRLEAGAGRGVGPVPKEVRGGADFGPPEPDDTLTPSDPSKIQSSQFESGSSSDEDDDIDPAWVSTHSASGDFDLNAAHAAAGRTGDDPFESFEPISSVSQFPSIYGSEGDEDDPTWGPFSDPAEDGAPLTTSFQFDAEDDFGDFHASDPRFSLSFEDSFDGSKSADSSSTSKDAIDDNIEEPTTPKASARKLSPSSSFESVENPDQEDSWSSVWPPPAPAPAGDTGAAAPDAVADAMTSHIVSR